MNSEHAHEKGSETSPHLIQLALCLQILIAQVHRTIRIWRLKAPYLLGKGKKYSLSLMIRTQ